jgi:hypothetical protein
MHLAMSWGWGATLPEKQGSAHVFLFPAVDVNLEKDPQARDAVEPVEGAVARPAEQGLTIVHFSAQLEPCLTHENT